MALKATVKNATTKKQDVKTFQLVRAVTQLLFNFALPKYMRNENKKLFKFKSSVGDFFFQDFYSQI